MLQLAGLVGQRTSKPSHRVSAMVAEVIVVIIHQKERDRMDQVLIKQQEDGLLSQRTCIALGTSLGTNVAGKLWSWQGLNLVTCLRLSHHRELQR